MARKVTALTTTNAAVTLAAETVVATVSNIDTPRPGCKVVVSATYQVTLGAGTTAVTTRIRRGTTTAGVLVGEANAEQISTAAGSTEAHTITVEDFPPEQANGSYVLTVQQTAGAADGSVLQSEVVADVDV